MKKGEPKANKRVTIQQCIVCGEDVYWDNRPRPIHDQCRKILKAKKDESKPKKVWAICAPNGDLFYCTFQKTERDAVADYVGGCQTSLAWRRLRDEGFRAVQVLVTPIDGFSVAKKRKAKIDKKVSATFDKRVLAQGGETR